MRNLLLIAVVLMGASCKKLTGDMTVKNHLVYRKGGSAKILLAGEYTATAKLRGKRKLTLKVANAFEKKTLKFKLAKGQALPTNGEFTLASKTINQPFALNGKLNTAATVGELVETTETCYPSYDYYCDGHFAGEYTPGMGAFGYCGPGRYNGRQDVKYRVVTTTTKLDLDMVQDAKVKATFAGSRSSEEKKYEFRGPCRF